MEEFKCRHKSTERPGLYVLVFLALLNSCDANEKAGKILTLLRETPAITYNIGVEQTPSNPAP